MEALPRHARPRDPAASQTTYHQMHYTLEGLSSNDQLLQESHQTGQEVSARDSPAPSLSYASSSAHSIPEEHATPADSQHQFGHPIPPGHPGEAALSSAKRQFSERSLLRVLSPPDGTQASMPQGIPAKGTTWASSSADQLPMTHHQPPRIRLHSNPGIKPKGFPYCNSANVLFQQGSNWRMSVTSHNSSANSSDDVDLDLSWDAPPPASQQRQHVGIDMGTLSIPEVCEDHGQRLQTDAPLGSLGSKSKCRSALDLRTRAKLDAQKLADTVPSPANPQVSLTMSGRPDSFLSEGWSFNRTEPSPDPGHVFSDQSQDSGRGMVTRRSSGSLRNKRAVPAPLRIWLDRSPRSNNTHTDTPGTLGTDSSFGSPTTSHGPMTPRSPGSAQLASRVEVVEGGVDEHSQEGHIGQYGSMSLSEFGSFGQGLVHSSTMASSAYKTAQSVPTSLTGAMEELSSSRSDGLQGLGFQHVHFPEEVDQRPIHERPSHPGLRPSGSNDMGRSPLSEISHSPTPDAPLMTDQNQQQRLGSTSRLSGWLPSSSRADIPSAATSERPASRRKSALPSLRRRPWLRGHLDDMVPAKTFFVLGFFAMPWLWFVGGWLLRPDGEFWGTRGAPCRCSTKTANAGLQCPADVHRSLRLLGVKPSGDGLMHDIRQLNSDGQNKAALLNINTRQASGFILANRVAAITASLVVVIVFILAIVALCRAF